MTQQLTDAALTSRFNLLERPLRSPGKCIVCGSVDRPVVDIRMDLEASDLQGFRTLATLYLCLDCLTEVSILFLDVVPGADYRAAQSTVASQKIQIENMAGNTDEYVSRMLDLHDTFIRGVGPNPSRVHVQDDEQEQVALSRSTADGHSEVRNANSSDEANGSAISSERPLSVPTDNGSDNDPFAGFEY